MSGYHEIKDIQFTLYPNPASSLIFIKISDFTSYNNLKATIHDLNGRLIKKTNISNETLNIDVSAMESAVYILNITSDTARATKRIVIDKKP